MILPSDVSRTIAAPGPSSGLDRSRRVFSKPSRFGFLVGMSLTIDAPAIHLCEKEDHDHLILNHLECSAS